VPRSGALPACSLVGLAGPQWGTIWRCSFFNGRKGHDKDGESAGMRQTVDVEVTMRAKSCRGIRGISVLIFSVMVCAGAGFAATIYVDDNAPNDPDPGNPAVSDPLENGTAEHPYDAIQQAIDAAAITGSISRAKGLPFADKMGRGIVSSISSKQHPGFGLHRVKPRRRYWTD
jgi:hypothetical protein